MSHIEIRPPQSVDEYREACALVDQAYWEAGYLSKRGSMKHPGAVIVAVKKGAIVGSVGLECAEHGCLPTERAFGFASEQICPYPRSSIFEPQRLAIADRSDLGAMKGLILGILGYSRFRCLGNQWIMTIKPTLAKAFLRYGHLKTEALEYQVRPEVIPDHPGYWTNLPAPIATRISREDVEVALTHLSAELEGRVRVDLSDFNHRLDYGREETYLHRLDRRCVFLTHQTA